MKRKIWKYLLEFGDGEQPIEIPKDAEVLYVAGQEGTICLWALVSPAAPAETRKFVIHGTGHPVGEKESYLGSVQMSPFVWHVFEVAA
jgi:hypothetical protein